MPIVEGLEQGTEAWHSYRSKGIGASDANAIMGVGFLTPFQLWLQKNGLAEPQKDNCNMEWGRTNEPIARQMFNEQCGFDCQPAVFVNPLYSWHFSSLDGYSKAGIFCEIKTTNYKDHETALRGKVPEKYIPQIMHQFEDTEFDIGYYVSYSPNHSQNFKWIGLHRDDFSKSAYEKLWQEEKEFYRRWQEFDPPKMSSKDYIESNDDELLILTCAWKMAHEQRKIHQEQEDRLRLQIIGKCQGQSTICNGMKMSNYPVRGRVNFDIVPQLQGVDLEPYRKPKSTAWRFTVE